MPEKKKKKKKRHETEEYLQGLRFQRKFLSLMSCSMKDSLETNPGEASASLPFVTIPLMQ